MSSKSIPLEYAHTLSFAIGRVLVQMVIIKNVYDTKFEMNIHRKKEMTKDVYIKYTKKICERSWNYI